MRKIEPIVRALAFAACLRSSDAVPGCDCPESALENAVANVSEIGMVEICTS